MTFKVIVILWLSAITIVLYLAGLPQEVGELNMACFKETGGEMVMVDCEVDK